MENVGSAIEVIHNRFIQAELSFGHGTDNAWDEAVALVLAVANCPDEKESLVLSLAEAEIDEVERLAEARITSRKPLAYLLGRAAYLGLQFHIRPGIVVPRSPIGFLLPDAIKPWQQTEVQTVVDLCAGSGCLGIVAAYYYPAASVTLVELDPIACDVARENVELHNLEQRVTVRQADVTEPLNLSADLVLCNPPYVDERDMRTLPQEYRHEPAHGLGAGRDGLDVMLPILSQTAEMLTAGGVMIGEVGASAAALARELPELPFVWLDLPEGGEGVFLLEADALNSHTARQ